MTIADHLLTAVLAVGIPLWVWRRWPKTKALLASDKPGVRSSTYLWNIAFLWSIAAVTLAIWAWLGRPWPDLGFALELGWGFWTALGVAAGLAALVTLQYTMLARTEEGRRRLRDAFGGDMLDFMPRDRREMGHFAAMSVSAGICEAIGYRGFLIWYVVQLVGGSTAGLTAAVAVSSVVFGLGHLYQGPKCAARIMGLALVFGGLYVVSGSLWIVMALHAYIDIASGLVGWYGQAKLAAGEVAETTTSSHDAPKPSQRVS